MRRESDEEYANRMIATGTYRSPLIEVASHPVLKGLFLKNLQDRDRRLYDVLLVLLCDVQILNQSPCWTDTFRRLPRRLLWLGHRFLSLSSLVSKRHLC